MNRWIIAIALFVCWSDAAAAAIACRSSPGSDDYYQYRLIDGKKCWYRGHKVIEKSALAWKSENRRPVRVAAAVVAGEAHGPSTLAVAPGSTATDRQEASTSAAASRRGEPAPDFDAVFGHFRAYDVARPPVHLLFPQRIAQAYGARPVATIAYRGMP